MKVKGSNAERDLVAKFWGENWASLRIAGSGSMKFPSCDVLASRDGRLLAVECKSTKKDSQYITKEQIADLHKFAGMFNAEPIIGVKFSKEWRFYTPEVLNKTPLGHTVINKKDSFKTFLDLITESNF